jgi:hypothetical protein
MEARTDVGLPAEHFELRVALVGGIAVELCCNVNDVVPLSGNVSRRADEYGDRPDHWNSEYCNQGRLVRVGCCGRDVPTPLRANDSLSTTTVGPDNYEPAS